MERIDLVIAQALRAPIDPNLPVPLAISEIAEVEEAQPGEMVRIFDYTGEDGNADDIYAIGDSTLTIHKVSPVEPATLTFAGLKSKLEYVLVDEVLPAADQNALARKKVGISRAMDKEELKRICDGVLSLDGDTDVGNVDCEVVQATEDDVYDLIVKMVQRVEDYATDYALLCGSAVKRAIDIYRKVNAENANYDVDLDGYLSKTGINVIKITGKVNGSAILATNKMILVGRRSGLAAGKPITFVRRLFDEKIAKYMNIESGLPGRAISVAQAPTVISSGSGLIGFAVFGYESIIEAITNYRAIAWSTLA